MVDRISAGMTDMDVFVAVAESGSFTRAAQRLGIGKSNAGKAIQRLEGRLSARLFQRTTRAVRLTEDGETYFKAVRLALDGLSEAENALAARRAEPEGRLRIDMPSALGRIFLPALQKVRQSHPKLTLDLSLSDRHADAVAEGWDMVIRIGHLPDQGEMVVRKLYTLRHGLYASPGYLSIRDLPKSIRDLEQHEAVVFRQAAGNLRSWTLNDGSRQFEFLPPTTGTIVSDGQALVDAVTDGFGIGQICDLSARSLLHAERLIHLLPDADVEGPPVHALVPAGRDMPKKTRVVLDALVDLLKRAG